MKKSTILKAWDRCKSFGRKESICKACNFIEDSTDCHNFHSFEGIKEEKPTPSKRKASNRKGFFSVYVGEEKKRFIVKTEVLSHPHFKMLLDDAELEYGFNPNGPLVLPCKVEEFYSILVAMDSSNDDIVADFPTCSPLVIYRPATPLKFMKLKS